MYCVGLCIVSKSMLIISILFDIMWCFEKMVYYVVEYYIWDDVRVLVLFAEVLRDHEKMMMQ